MQHERKASEIATGRWPGILMRMGIDERFLNGKHGPCPICGGKDRFRFDDKEGRGTWICSQCGSGDGFDMLQRVNGWTFREAAKEVEAMAGYVKAAAIKVQADDDSKMLAVRRIWCEADPVSKGDPVWQYLEKRRINPAKIPTCLRFHPALAYVDGDGVMDHHPAMVAAVTNAEGKGIGVHRVYLDMQGNKASVNGPTKKLMVGKKMNGSAVRLGAVDDVLGIAEGIETAMAASMLFSVPVWSAISAGMMEAWTPPEQVRRVVVFGDNDKTYTGQASAFSLAKRLSMAGLSVEVKIPDVQGKDWADAV